LYVRTISETRERDAKEWLARAAVAMPLCKGLGQPVNKHVLYNPHNILFRLRPRRQSCCAGLGGGRTGRVRQRDKASQRRCPHGASIMRLGRFYLKISGFPLAHTQAGQHAQSKERLAVQLADRCIGILVPFQHLRNCKLEVLLRHVLSSFSQSVHARFCANTANFSSRTLPHLLC